MTDHYWTGRPDAPSQPATVHLRLPDVTLTLTTDRGVFSGQRVDPGTMVLLRAAPDPPARGNLLDLGCGYGPIALTLAHRAPGASVWAVDVNTRALELVRANAAAAGCANVTTAEPDAVAPDLRFAAIYSNPPVRIGKPRLHGLLREWLARLEGRGHAYLVVHKHLGSDSLTRWLAEQGWVVSRLASKTGYRVLDVTAG